MTGRPVAAKLEEKKSFEQVAASFDMSAGVKANPFLMMDKAKKKKAPPVVPKAAPPPPPPSAKDAESRPIVPLNETQKAELQNKRKSITRSHWSYRANSAPAVVGTFVPPPVEKEEHEEDEQGPPTPSSPAMEEAGVMVAPAAFASPVAAPPVAEPVAAPPAAPEAKADDEQARAPTVPAEKVEAVKPMAAVVAPKGDLDGLKASPELLAALSAMLPVLDRQIVDAKAVEATAEPAIEVLRRCRRNAKRQRR